MCTLSVALREVTEKMAEGSLLDLPWELTGRPRACIGGW